MTAPAPHLTDLSADNRRQLESLLLKFDQSWDEKRLPAVLRLLPADSPLRRPALIELIKIDLEHRRKAGQKVRVEAYLKPFPELGTADDLPVDLILAEYQVRRQFGTAPGLSDYAQRFPRQIEELRGRIQVADRESTGPDVSGASTPTLRPAEAKHSTVSQAAGTTGATAMPEQFGRYRILKCLGRGGMGSVYLAHDAQLDRQVALKAPHFAAGDGPEVLERFTREARAAATLDHPNICPVYDVGVHDGVHYVTMAYVEGRPLSELVRDGKPLPPRPAAAVVRKLALALSEAHRHGVIHRDLKPANVMVNRRKEPVIMDFGLARRIDKEDQRLTKVGAILGTPAYMPPEQVSGDIEAMGPACDIYSLGVMLYEMLTGRPPFQGPLAAVLGQILTKQPEPPSKLRPGLDPDLEATCLKAMAKKPEDRFASMDALADALGRFLKGEAPPAKARSAASVAKGRPPAGGKKAESSEGTDLAENLLARLVDRLETQPARASESPPPPPPQRGAPWWIAPVAALVIVGGLVAGGMFLMRFAPSVVVNNANNNNNAVVVQLTGLADRLSDPTIVVLIDGQPYTREQLAKPISLTVGDHDLVVKRGDVVIESRKLPIGRGDNQVAVAPSPTGTPVGPGPGQTPAGDGPKDQPSKPTEPVYLKEHTRAVTDVLFSADGDTLYSASLDNSVIVWDVAAGKKTKELLHPDNVVALSRVGNGETLATVQKQGPVTLWKASGAKDSTLTLPAGVNPKDTLVAIVFNPDASLAVFKFAFSVVIWDAAKRNVVATIKQYGSYETDVGTPVPSPDWKTLAIPWVDNDVVLWDVATRQERRLKGHANPVNAVAFSPDGGTIATASQDRTVKLWNVTTGEPIANLRGHEATIRYVQFSSDGKTLATRDGGPYVLGEGALKLWDVGAAKEIPVHPVLAPVGEYLLSPDGKEVAVSFRDKQTEKWTIRVVDVASGQDRLSRPDDKGAVCMTLSAKGVLAWGREDGTVVLWDVGWKKPAAAKPELPAPPAGEPSAAVKALLDALTDPDSNDVRRQAAESLKKLGDKTAVGPLEERVADDLFKGDPSGWSNSSASSKCAAVDALKELGPDRVTPALIRATHSATEDVRLWACWELGTLKDKLKTKEGTDGLIAALKNDKAVAVRAEAAKELATGRHSAVPALADALFDPENEVRREAAKTLRALGDRSANRPDAVKLVIDGATPALEKRVADDQFKGDPGGWSNSSASSKCAAVDALRELAPERVTPALLGALAREKNEDVRLWACWELGQQNDKESLEGLAAASKADKSPSVREGALKAMTQRNK